MKLKFNIEIDEGKINTYGINLQQISIPHIRCIYINGIYHMGENDSVFDVHIVVYPGYPAGESYMIQYRPYGGEATVMNSLSHISQ
jgi:hypothetical protein